jgi:hypothetical protein
MFRGKGNWLETDYVVAALLTSESDQLDWNRMACSRHWQARLAGDSRY